MTTLVTKRNAPLMYYFLVITIGIAPLQKPSL